MHAVNQLRNPLTRAFVTSINSSQISTVGSAASIAFLDLGGIASVDVSSNFIVGLGA
jgi:hypothetical protein